MARITVMMFFLFIFGAFSAHGATAKTVLFDNHHGERFTVGGEGPLQLSGFADIVRSAGAEVATLDQRITDATLSGADGLVISGAFAPLDREEVEAVVRFMERGGRVAVMLHIAPPVGDLLERFGVGYSNGVMRENDNVIEKEPLNFRVSRLGDHPVMQGLHEFSVYGAWGLINLGNKSRIVASTGPNAWIDLHRDGIQKKATTGSFGIVVAGDVGKGGFIVFGDDAIFQNKFLDANNKALAHNLAGWLK